MSHRQVSRLAGAHLHLLKMHGNGQQICQPKLPKAEVAKLLRKIDMQLHAHPPTHRTATN
jgi:hypothetical protein